MGYIYAFRNDYHAEDVYKTGSTDDIEARLKQANITDTWKVGEFKCVLKVKTVNHRKKEAQLHQLIKDMKCPGNAREFFKIHLDQINCFFKLIGNEDHLEEVEEAPKPIPKPKLTIKKKREAEFQCFFDECVVKDDSEIELMTFGDVWRKYTEWYSINECKYKLPMRLFNEWINNQVNEPVADCREWKGYSLKQCEIFDDIELGSHWNDLDQNN